MARPRTEVGDWGKISSKQMAPKKFRAWANYRGADGKRRMVQRYGTTASEAEKAVQTAVKELADRNSGSGALTAASTVDQLSEAWLDSLDHQPEKYSDSTRHEYRATYKRSVSDALGSLTIREATPGRVNDFILAVGAKHPSTARKCRAVLVGMFDHAVRMDAAKFNPAKSSIRPTSKNDGPRALTLDELQELRETVAAWQSEKTAGRKRSQDMSDALEILAATGIRVGELMALRWSDVRLDTTPATLTVCGTVKRQLGDGGALYRQDNPKSRAGYRTVKLPKFATDVLLKRSVSSESEYVFPSSTGGLKCPKNFSRQWRDARGETFDWVVPHSFRKAVATLLAGESNNDRATMLQLGHSRIATTEEHYIDRPNEAPDLTDVLDRLAPKK